MGMPLEPGVEQDMAHEPEDVLELASLPAGHGAGGVVPARTSQDMARGADFLPLLLAGIPRCSFPDCFQPLSLQVPSLG